jgi:hypothetical protein
MPCWTSPPDGVFLAVLTVKYYGPNSVIDRGIQDNVKEKYYSNGDIVDWSKLKAVLDVRTVKKDKYEYLISWTGLTVGNDTWVAQNHIPGRLDDYLKQFRETHEQQYVKASKK